ncbi:MAG TPA: serine/threonine-protein kinase [Kofleriaceae bacterium]
MAQSSGSRSWFRRMFGRKTAPPVIAAPAPEPQHLGSEEEVFLAQLVQDLGDGKRRDEICSKDVIARLEGMWKSGHERLSIEWCEKLLSVPGLAAEHTAILRATLVERYEQRGELDSAITHLEILITNEPHALRAHYLLAEHARKKADHELALRHYEAVLGRDVDYPNVRVRVERLRQLTGRAAPIAGETIAAGDVAGVQAGARYRLVRELGRGATGVVYLARDAELDREVAIKLLHPHLAGTERADALARFFHEARVMASLRHPNVVAVLDMDEASRRIVMELAAGGTLRDVLRERGPRSLRRGMERHGQVLSALAAAHRRGIVHCDLKPGNLMFRRDADLPGVEIMLGDFGVAHLPDASGQASADGTRVAEPSGAVPVALPAMPPERSGPDSLRPAGMTKRAEAIGTLAYMAPEQRRGEVSPASDIYASAVVLFEMLTGHTPGARGGVIGSLREAADFRLPAELFGEVSAELAGDVQHHIDRISDPDPLKRPTTMQALTESQRLRERIIAAGAS